MSFLEKVVFKIVEKGGDLGVTIGELKSQVILEVTDVHGATLSKQLNEMLKSLEKKGEIKTIKG